MIALSDDMDDGSSDCAEDLEDVPPAAVVMSLLKYSASLISSTSSSWITLRPEVLTLKHVPNQGAESEEHHPVGKGSNSLAAGSTSGSTSQTVHEHAIWHLLCT